MKRENIEVRRTRRRREAVRGVLFFALIQCFAAGVLVWACLLPDLPGWAAGLFAFLAAAILLSLFPAFWVLKKRFQEIEGGELDDAGQY